MNQSKKGLTKEEKYIVQISAVNITGSLGFIPMCPKKIGLRKVKIQDRIAISLLKIFLFTKNNPSMPKEENE